MVSHLLLGLELALGWLPPVPSLAHCSPLIPIYHPAIAVTLLAYHKFALLSPFSCRVNSKAEDQRSLKMFFPSGTF